MRLAFKVINNRKLSATGHVLDAQWASLLMASHTLVALYNSHVIIIVISSAC